MLTIILANIIDFLAAMVQIYSGAIKSKQKILAAQTLQIGMQTISMFMLGGITGCINNVLSCIRNVLCYKEMLTLPLKIILIVLSGLLTVLFNTQGLLGYLPFAVCTFYIIFMDIKDPLRFKFLVTLTFIPWVVYYLIIQSYTGAFFAIATIITNVITMWKMKKE